MDAKIRTVITYPLNGTTTEFDIPFEYLARKFVVVTLKGPSGDKLLTVATDYRFPTKRIIKTTRAFGPADGYTSIELRRVTSAIDRLVDFNDGAILRANDLNISQVQSLHVAEEGRDQTVDLATAAAEVATKAAAESEGFRDEAEQIAENIRQTGQYGYIPVESFEKGFTLESWKEALLYEATGEYYVWTGSLPKTVPPMSTPISSGNQWIIVGIATLAEKLNGPDGYKEIPSIYEKLGEVPAELFETVGMTDEFILQDAINKATAKGLTLVLPKGRVYITPSVNVTCNVRGKATIKRASGTSQTLVNLASGCKLYGGLVVDGDADNNTGYACNIQMAGGSGRDVHHISSINALGHNIEIINQTDSVGRVPNKVRSCVVDKTAIGHGIYGWNILNDEIERNTIRNATAGVSIDGNARSVRPMRIVYNNVEDCRGNGIATTFIDKVDNPVSEFALVHGNYVTRVAHNAYAIQSHHTVVTSNRSYSTGTTFEHQGILVNADGCTVTANVVQLCAGVGIDMGDCRKSTVTANVVEECGWIGIEVNSCEDTVVSANILNLCFRGKSAGPMQGAITVHKGDGGIPFNGPSRGIIIKGNAIGPGEGQAYAIYVDENSYDVIVTANNCANAGKIEDIFTKSSKVKVYGNVDRWSPSKAARVQIAASGGGLAIPSVGETLIVSGTGSVISIPIMNNGAFVEDRTVRLKAESGFTLEPSGSNGTGNLFMPKPIVVPGGRCVTLWTDGTGGWVLANEIY